MTETMPLLSTLQPCVSSVISRLQSLSYAGWLAIVASGWVVLKVVRRLTTKRTLMTKLRGPPRKSYRGYSEELMKDEYPEEQIKAWVNEYGPVYQIPWLAGRKRVVLCDPLALQHISSKDTYAYVHTPFGKRALNTIVGPGVLTTENDVHKRQRRILTPAFSNVAIRNLTGVFYDSGYRLKAAWDNLFASSVDGSLIINVQGWMNRVTFDTIGLAGFSHNFGTLEGNEPPLFHAVQHFSEKPGVGVMLMALIPALRPFFGWTSMAARMRQMRRGLSEVAEQMLKTSMAQKGTEEVHDKSVIGLLLNSLDPGSKTVMTADEVLGQMNTLLLAGYETTSIALTWALIELARNPDKQDKLREELLAFGGDPSWDDLISTEKLPYLDGVVHEILRIHSSAPEVMRISDEDDVVPLHEPVTTTTGETVNSIILPKGTLIVVPILVLNTLATYWGEDSAVFKPERWSEIESGTKEAPGRIGELKGYRHLMTFFDGPRTCLGKGFALAEFKAVLYVLIRNYTFEFPGPDGRNTKIGTHRAMINRPKVAGENGPIVPLRVRKVN